MTQTRDYAVLILALATLVGAVSLFFLFLQSPTFHLVVESDNGGSIHVGGDVLLKGEPIETGQSIRVINKPLTLVTSNRDVGMRFYPGSLVHFPRIQPDSAIIRLRVRAGTGVIQVKQGIVSGTILQRSLRLNRGTVRWTSNNKTLTHVSSQISKGHFLRDSPLGALSTGRRLPGFHRGFPSAVNKKEHWQLGSLVPGIEVLEAVKQYTRRHGYAPQRLRDVFGYWVRDRRGNVYLYEHNQSGIRITGAGPDEALLTRDDRHWKTSFDLLTEEN